MVKSLITFTTVHDVLQRLKIISPVRPLSERQCDNICLVLVERLRQMANDRHVPGLIPQESKAIFRIFDECHE